MRCGLGVLDDSIGGNAAASVPLTAPATGTTAGMNTGTRAQQTHRGQASSQGSDGEPLVASVHESGATIISRSDD